MFDHAIKYRNIWFIKPICINHKIKKNMLPYYRFVHIFNYFAESWAALNSLGYVWNETIGKCCHYQSIKINILNSRKRCMREAPKSRLLLVNSDETFSFAKDIIGKHDFFCPISAVLNMLFHWYIRYSIYPFKTSLICCHSNCNTL